MSMGGKNALNCLWLNPTILTWNAEPAAERKKEDLWRRPYEMWSHAESLLQTDASKFQRTDALTTLKRTVDRRVQQLHIFLNLKNLPIANKPSGNLELLEYVGLLRPMMLQHLIEIRNAVEHKDAPPPTVKELNTFLDFVWYFMRSTDNALRHPLDKFHMQPGDLDEISPYSFEVTLSPNTNWIPKINGYVEPDMLSAEAKKGWLVVNVRRTETRKQMMNRLRRYFFEMAGGLGKKPDDIHLVCEVRGPKEAVLHLIRISFQLI
jgi:hypothetical protein